MNNRASENRKGATGPTGVPCTVSCGSHFPHNRLLLDTTPPVSMPTPHSGPQCAPRAESGCSTASLSPAPAPHTPANSSPVAAAPAEGQPLPSLSGTDSPGPAAWGGEERGRLCEMLEPPQWVSNSKMLGPGGLEEQPRGPGAWSSPSSHLFSISSLMSMPCCSSSSFWAKFQSTGSEGGPGGGGTPRSRSSRACSG